MTADEAVKFVRDKLADWSTLPAQIAAELARSQELAGRAAQQGRPELQAEASSAGGVLAALGTVVRSTTDKVVTFLRDMAGQGAPVAPVKLTGPYCSDYARAHPELYTCSDASLGAEGFAATAARFRARPQAAPGFPYRRRSRAVAATLRPRILPPVPTVFRHPNALPVLKMPAYIPVESEVNGCSSGELGAVPVVLGAVAIALAAAMAAAYKALDVQRKRLDLVERGIIPADSGPTPTFGGELGKKAGALLPWIAAGAAAWFLWPKISQAMRGRSA